MPDSFVLPLRVERQPHTADHPIPDIGLEHAEAVLVDAHAHQEELREAAGDEWATPKELAARWKVSVTTVKDTPADELP